jgi:peptidoglycan/xylan/chitin deacetylase (PgdA/CDA1 family)
VEVIRMPFERPTWPGDAKCAVLLTFDNFGESLDLLRYGHAGGATADGVYAPRRGVERVMDLLERKGVRGTFFVEGWNARKYASLAREIVARGHEVAAHGWMHETWNTLPLAQEQELIRRTTATLTDVLGKPVAGWRAPGGLITASTLSLLYDAGYSYDSSCGDDDVPYTLEVAVGRQPDTLLELPWTWPLDDAPFYSHTGAMRRPSEVLQLWSEEFDAADKLTGFFHLVCHPRFTGRPARILVLEQLIDYIQARSGVWFAMCKEVAEHARVASWTPRHAAPAVADSDG